MIDHATIIFISATKPIEEVDSPISEPEQPSDNDVQTSEVSLSLMVRAVACEVSIPTHSKCYFLLGHKIEGKNDIAVINSKAFLC